MQQLDQYNPERRDPFDRHRFIVESNLIDKQYIAKDEFIPGDRPGTLMYDNTVRAFELFPELTQSDPLPNDLLHRFHRELLAEVPGLDQERFVGRYRTVGVTIGKFIKCPSARVAQGIIEKRLLPAINEKREERLSPSEARKFAWWCHDLFECAHPYIDGNGRTGRILHNFVCSLFGAEGEVVHFDDRKKYYAKIQEFRFGPFAEIMSELGYSKKTIDEVCSPEKIKQREQDYWAKFYLELMKLEERQQEDGHT